MKVNDRLPNSFYFRSTIQIKISQLAYLPYYLIGFTFLFSKIIKKYPKEV